MGIVIRFLEKPDEMTRVEALQRAVWPGSETDVVPAHLLLTAAHNGGLVMGAFDGEDGPLVGFVFGFPGLYFTPDGPRPKHCSHMLGVHPDYRDRGVGFRLKRAQWQWVRHQELDLITWTYDPLLSRNAHLNIARLGAVCRTYLREVYGEMRDGLNVGLPSDRFQVEWWVQSKRVAQRLSQEPRKRLTLAHAMQAGVSVINPAQHDGPWPRPTWSWQMPTPDDRHPLLVEIPSDFLALKAADRDLALDWRLHTREVFEFLFQLGYLVTDFVFEREPFPRSFYLISHGESVLG